jgi:ATP-dependent DNA helicase DinG
MPLLAKDIFFFTFWPRARREVGKMDKWLTPKFAASLQRQIDAVGPFRRFFLAVLGAAGLEGARVLAEEELDQVIPLPGKGTVVIALNPGEALLPSGTDITAAARLAKKGVGYVIVSGNLDRSYTLTEPVSDVPGARVSPDFVAAVLGPEGRIADALPAYESRPQQVAMAVSLAEALNAKNHALAEAGTGVGKSLAYLVPALCWARENKGRVVISTNTINLQEQLLYKDIPLLQQSLPFSFSAILVKGRTNYLCRRKLRERLERGEDWGEGEESALQALAAWEKTSREGSRSDLAFSPGSLWDQVCSEGDTCLRQECRFYRDCFFYKARQDVMAAQILIANHSLLFADISLRQKGAEARILPEYQCLVLDEAHNVEKAATDWLGGRVTRLGFTRLLARLYTARSNKARGLLVVLENKIAASIELDGELIRGLLEMVRQMVLQTIRVGGEVDEFFAATEGLLAEKGKKENKVRLSADSLSSLGWQRLASRADTLFPLLEDLGQGLGLLSRRLEGLGPESFEPVLAQVVELQGIRARLAKLREDLQEVLAGRDPSLVRWAELAFANRGPRAVFCYAPLAVSGVLKENLWEKVPTALLTSATLTANGSFAYIRERLGLEGDLVRELQYDSPFNYREQVRLGVATDLPEPSERGFQEKIIAIIGESLRATRGKGLVLFTSFALLKAAATALAEDLAQQGIAMYCQGDMPRHQLLQKFRGDTASVLLATASFWEGVDVPGESLSSLILTRLPFSVPDEPVFQARMEELEKQGKDPFYSMQMPLAVLRFKQGFGRLIRSRQDRGVVLVLDKRIVTRSYGRWFLKSLPPCPLLSGPAGKVLAWHKDFLG